MATVTETPTINPSTGQGVSAPVNVPGPSGVVAPNVSTSGIAPSVPMDAADASESNQERIKTLAEYWQVTEAEAAERDAAMRAQSAEDSARAQAAAEAAASGTTLPAAPVKKNDAAVKG